MSLKFKIKESDILPPFSLPEAKVLADRMNIDLEEIGADIHEFLNGINIELEHKVLTKGDPSDTALIAIDHLREDPLYYTKLKKMESDAKDKKYSDQEFWSEIESEIKDAMDVSATLAANRIVSFANKLDRSGEFTDADELDRQFLSSTAGIIDSIRKKIDDARNRRKGPEDPGISEDKAAPATIKLNPGLVVNNIAGKPMIFYTDNDLDKAVRERKLEINTIIKAILSKMVQFKLDEHVKQIEAAQFADRYRVAREAATKSGLLT